MKPLNQTIVDFKESIFTTMTKLANEHRAINLSQGFPDFDGPSFVIDYAKKALDEGAALKNQYAPAMGAIELRKAISYNYKKLYHLDYSFENQILVTNGATEALFCALLAMVNPGDDVIVFEPFYDSYVHTLLMAKANIIPITLKKPDFSFDREEFKKAVSSKTKLIILNNPHNPTGKVFSDDEISFLREMAIIHDFYIVSDEVYEFLTYDCDHRPTATFPELYERTLTISSTGKTFGLTGWKIGWVLGPSELIKAINNVHQFSSFCVAHPLQLAMANALMSMDDYLVEFKTSYRQKRDKLYSGLLDVGFQVFQSAGTYFLVAEIAPAQNDVQFCQNLIREKQVAAIPTSPFYLKSKEGESLIRFCFAKKEATLAAALNSLK